ncbi:MAG: DMT family transporter [Planctomycetes bacterium]|nr:DMT family transporter [Planctomycetota bacterium]
MGSARRPYASRAVTARTALFTALALVGFAGNSLLCRAALADGSIDPASFTAVRLASGGVVLLGLARLASGARPLAGSWAGAVALFAYAAPFSYAYLRLGAATGALVLFVAVQITMVGIGVARGERPRSLAWCGLAVALAGLAALTLRGAGAADPWGLCGMTLAGISWGVYSLLGRRGLETPLAATAGNFVRAVPLAGVLLVWAAATSVLEVRRTGFWLAVGSGAAASGLGYSLWYAALPALSAARAAVLQLLVPVLTSLGGVALLGEALTLRFAVSAAAILLGVGLVIRGRA